MLSVKYLNTIERSQILEWRSNKIKIEDIATTIGRSRHVVDKFIKMCDSYGKNQKNMGNIKFLLYDRWELFRLASNGLKSSSKIKCNLNLNVSSQTLQRQL